MNRRVEICEVVTRDGFQTTERIIGVDEKLKILDMLAEAGVKSIEVGAFSRFESMKKMRNTGEVFRHLKKKKGIQYRALVFEPEGTKEAADCGCDKVKINISASSQHHKSGTGMDIDSAIKGFEKIAQIAETEKIEMCGSISLPFRSPFPGEGMIDMGILKKIIQSFYDIGIREISLSDSAGLGDPELIFHRFQTLHTLYPDISWMLHMHNTYGMGLAGVEAAWRAGVEKFDASLAGLGGCPYIQGATGNVSTEDVLFLFQMMGVETGIDLERMVEAGRFVAELVEGQGTDSYIQKIKAFKEKGGYII